MLWWDEFDLQIQSYSQRHIHAKLQYGKSTEEWQLTGFYGHPDATRRTGIC